jgi:hypothetical protein
MSLFKQSTAANVAFLMISNADNTSPVTGLTPTVTISKNNAAFASPGGSVSEIGNGWYSLALNTTDAGTLGELLLHATGTGANNVDDRHQVVVDLPGATVSSVTGNVGGNVTGSVGSVVGAVGSVTGAVGSVTGNVGGNVVGNVNGNVVGSVASVTAPVTVGTNNDKTGYALAVAQVPFKKNTALAGFTFPMFNSSGAPLTGLTVTAQRVIDGGVIASCTNAVTEVSNGIYAINLAAADLNGNSITFLMSAAGAVVTTFTAVTQ